MLIEVVGNNIRYYREIKGLTQKEAAARTGFSPVYWGYLEKGKKNLSVKVISKITATLGIEAYQLFITSLEKDLPVETLQLLHQINRLHPKHMDFIATVLRTYAKIHM